MLATIRALEGASLESSRLGNQRLTDAGCKGMDAGARHASRGLRPGMGAATPTAIDFTSRSVGTEVWSRLGSLSPPRYARAGGVRPDEDMDVGESTAACPQCEPPSVVVKIPAKRVPATR